MKYKKRLYALCGCIFLFGVWGSAGMMKKPGTDYVRIVRDGETLYEFDLAHTEERIFDIEYGGSVNRVEIKGHRIRMADAGCPDKTCVQMGWLDSSVPIVCLPNHLVIQFSSADVETDAGTY